MARWTEYLSFRWLRPHHFILLMGISAFLAISCGYAISVGTGKVAAFFPYVSDLGTTIPSGCVFALFLNLSAVFSFVTMYILHSHNESLLVAQRDQLINDVTLFFGILINIGLMMVACFPWMKVIVPHLVGALLVFVLGNVYCWIHCYLSYVIGQSTFSGKVIIRILLSLLSSVGHILTFVFIRRAKTMVQRKGKHIDPLHWKSTDPGYFEHLVSAFSEWIMVISFLSYFFTYYGEFKNLVCTCKVSGKAYKELDEKQ